MKQCAFLLIAFTIVAGCAKSPSPSAPEPVRTVTAKSLPQEAQSALDRLNGACASDPWREEIDLIERPETRPENRAISGEVSAFVSDCKERLAKQGVQVKWNSEKKLYEVDKTQPKDALDSK